LTGLDSDPVCAVGTERLQCPSYIALASGRERASDPRGRKAVLGNSLPYQVVCLGGGDIGGRGRCRPVGYVRLCVIDRAARRDVVVLINIAGEIGRCSDRAAESEGYVLRACRNARTDSNALLDAVGRVSGIDRGGPLRIRFIIRKSNSDVRVVEEHSYDKAIIGKGGVGQGYLDRGVLRWHVHLIDRYTLNQSGRCACACRPPSRHLHQDLSMGRKREGDGKED